MMSIDQLLAVIPVSDMERAQPWYELLMGRPEDNHPMVTLVEWKITDTGWLQVSHDPERAGTTLLNLAVDDLDTHLAELAGRGLATGDIVSANKGVRLSTIIDPDGNRITFIGGFRNVY
jgi:predicted enzyme related to lactoylglutathione lyase